MVWLVVFADLQGYWVYHIYFNQAIYSDFIDFSLTQILRNFSVSFAPDGLVHALAILLLWCWLGIFLSLRHNASPARTLLKRALIGGVIATGVVLINPRGDATFHNAGFLIANFALFALASAVLLQRSVPTDSRLRVGGALLVPVGALLVAQVASERASWLGVAGADFTPFDAQLEVDTSEVYSFIRGITREEGDLLALVYSPDVYIKAGRLPASGHLYYLPWQAAYNRQSQPGYRIDICSDLQQRQPAVIWFFNWRVWDKYAIENYEPCILTHIVEGYSPLQLNSPWYIRNDVMEANRTELPRISASEEPFMGYVARGPRLGRSGASSITMTSEHAARSTALKRIGLMLATNGTQRSGELAIDLKTATGVSYSTSVDARNLEDGAYLYVDLAPNRYTSGEIRRISGEGEVGVWESRFERTAYTCAAYEYVDGTRGYTPACPLPVLHRVATRGM